MRHLVSLRLDLLQIPGEPRRGRVGPGKIALLEAIAREGSISAAARALELSYRRAWLMTDEMNRLFSEPVVTAGRGGDKGGTATVTPTGTALITAFRALEQDAGKRANEILAPVLRAVQKN